MLPDALLTEHGLTASSVLASEVPANLPAAVMALAAFARRHLALAREHAAKLPTGAQPVFLPLAIVEPLLNRIERLGLDVTKTDTGISNLESLTRIGWARLRGQGRRR